MRIERMTAATGFALAVVLLGACSVTTQTTSGRDFLRAIPQSNSTSKDVFEQRIHEAANVEPILRFPARIGLARIGMDFGVLALKQTPAEDGKAWLELVDELGPEYGEFVPISPLIAAMMTPERPAHQRRDLVRDTLETVRLAAARQHLDAV